MLLSPILYHLIISHISVFMPLDHTYLCCNYEEYCAK